MTTDTYKLSEGEAMRCLAVVIGDPKLTDLVEKGWWE